MTLLLSLACRSAPEIEVAVSGTADPNCPEAIEDCCADLRYWSGTPGQEFTATIEGTLSDERAERVFEAAEGFQLVLFAYLSECFHEWYIEPQEPEWAAAGAGEATVGLGPTGPEEGIIWDPERPWILLVSNDERVNSMEAYYVEYQPE